MPQDINRTQDECKRSYADEDRHDLINQYKISECCGISHGVGNMVIVVRTPIPATSASAGTSP